MSTGPLLEVNFSEYGVQEVGAAVRLYSGGLALAVNADCETDKLGEEGVLCEDVSLVRVTDSGSVDWVVRLGPQPMRVRTVAEVAPGYLAVGGVADFDGVRKGFLFMVVDGTVAWQGDFPEDSVVTSVVAATDGVWVAGNSGPFGFVRRYDDIEKGGTPDEWVLEDSAAPPDEQIVESTIRALWPATDKGVYALGTVARGSEPRDTWVARFIGVGKPSDENRSEQHVTSEGYPDEPSAMVALSQGLVAAVLDRKEDQVLLVRYEQNDLRKGYVDRTALEKGKYRVYHAARLDGSGEGALLAGARRPSAKGEFEPWAMVLTAEGAPDPAWSTAGETGVRLRSEPGRAVWAVGGKAGEPMVAGWFEGKSSKILGFLLRL